MQWRRKRTHARGLRLYRGIVRAEEVISASLPAARLQHMHAYAITQSTML